MSYTFFLNTDAKIKPGDGRVWETHVGTKNVIINDENVETLQLKETLDSIGAALCEQMKVDEIVFHNIEFSWNRYEKSEARDEQS